MEKPIKLTEKYERNGWPSLSRPDLHAPEGWSLSLITSIERIRNHRLSPDGKMMAYIKDGETLSDVFVLPAAGGWPTRISTGADFLFARQRHQGRQHDVLRIDFEEIA